ISDQPPVDLFGRARDRDEGFEVVAVNTDVEPDELLQAKQPLDVFRPGNREIREERIGDDIRMRVEKLELVENVPVHENVAGTGRQFETVVAELERLLDAIEEELIGHRNLRTLLLVVSAEPAFQIAETRRLDVKRIALARDKLAPEKSVDIDFHGRPGIGDR